MHTQLKRSIIALAEANPTEEICGFVYKTPGGVALHQCPNVTQDPEGRARAFEISEEDYLTALSLGRVCAIYHSHSRGGAGAAFSEEDLAVSRAMLLPMYLYAVEGAEWATYIPPGYEEPLVGRDWRWGMDDCYETIRLYYRQVRGVYLGDYERDETFENAPSSAITQYITSEGFSFVPKGSPIEEHDVLLFKTPGNAYPHHLAVFLGHSQVLHHPRGQLSCREQLNGNWMKRLEGALRYTGKPSVLKGSIT